MDNGYGLIIKAQFEHFVANKLFIRHSCFLDANVAYSICTVCLIKSANSESDVFLFQQVSN